MLLSSILLCLHNAAILDAALLYSATPNAIPLSLPNYLFGIQWDIPLDAARMYAAMPNAAQLDAALLQSVTPNAARRCSLLYAAMPDAARLYAAVPDAALLENGNKLCNYSTYNPDHLYSIPWQLE